MDFVVCLNSLREQLEIYIKSNNIKALVIGESGGLDSAVNTVIARKVCDKLNIPLIGRFIQIESNKEDEKNRADNIGKLFCTDYQAVDLTNEYIVLRDACELNYPDMDKENLSKEDKIRRGNIKARLRMTYLRDLCQKNHGIGIDNTNRSEWELGFFTLNDNMDISPLFEMWKTHEYSFAKFLLTTLNNKEEKEALQACIDAVPTDGLGISSSDLEQMGCDSYNEVDDILMTLIPLYNINNCGKEFDDAYQKLENKYNTDKVCAVWSRHLNSQFKRNGMKKLHTYLYYGKC